MVRRRTTGTKHKRGHSSTSPSPEIIKDEAGSAEPIQEESVHVGEWQIKTWYFSPCPLIETEIDDSMASSSTSLPSSSL
ncbi:hypothetical protein APHAL10511_008213 [Amanita phalloides]|nr:hypothetical protein APHAL10511_008213 [Amanita phalloides]